MEIEKGKFALNSDIVFKVIEGEAVIVHPKNAMITSVNSVGTFILELLNTDTKSTFEVLLKKLMENYEVDYEPAKKDLEEFLKQLHANNLIVLN